MADYWFCRDWKAYCDGSRLVFRGRAGGKSEFQLLAAYDELQQSAVGLHAEIKRLKAQAQVMADYLCMASPGIQADCMVALAELADTVEVKEK